MSKLLDLLVEFLIKPFFSEKIRVLKYYDQKSTAERLLASSDPRRVKKGLSLLFELALSYPYRMQEVINRIARFLRERFPQEQEVDLRLLEVQELAIRSLASLPRLDQNGFPYNFDMHQVRIGTAREKMDLTRTNFNFFSLWGCQFVNVILSHSCFEDADLGGTTFLDCSLEYGNFKKSKICGSFMDQGRPTQFRKTRLWGTNLIDAEIELCDVTRHDEERTMSLQGLQERFGGKIRISG